MLGSRDHFRLIPYSDNSDIVSRSGFYTQNGQEALRKYLFSNHSTFKIAYKCLLIRIAAISYLFVCIRRPTAIDAIGNTVLKQKLIHWLPCTPPLE